MAYSGLAAAVCIYDNAVGCRCFSDVADELEDSWEFTDFNILQLHFSHGWWKRQKVRGFGNPTVHPKLHPRRRFHGSRPSAVRRLLFRGRPPGASLPRVQRAPRPSGRSDGPCGCCRSVAAQRRGSSDHAPHTLFETPLNTLCEDTHQPANPDNPGP